MKVLFLDVDGVLNCEDTYQTAVGIFPLDPYMAFLVGKIQLDTDCKVVLSSSWRHYPAGVEAIEKRVVKLFDKTPTNDLVQFEDKPRGNEIKAWLDKHPSVTRYAIVDDDSDMLDEQLPNFFRTSFKTGLTEDIAKNITEHLNG